MVLAEMAELGAFVSDGDTWLNTARGPKLLRGGVGQEGVAMGHVYLHEPRVVVTHLVADDPEAEITRLDTALETMRLSVEDLLTAAGKKDREQAEVLEAYRMFANSKGWRRRMVADIQRGMSAEAAVEKEQSAARARLGQVKDAYLKERLNDLDDLSNKLLRILTGQGRDNRGADARGADPDCPHHWPRRVAGIRAIPEGHCAGRRLRRCPRRHLSPAPWPFRW